MKVILREIQKISLSNHYLRTSNNKSIFITTTNQNQLINLTELLHNHKCNILKSINILNKNNIISNNYIIQYSLICDNVRLANLSNKTMYIHNYNLLDYIYPRFIDINQLTNDLYLHIEFINFKQLDSIPNEFISCNVCYSNVQIRKFNIPKNIIENIQFYKPIQYINYRDKLILKNYYSTLTNNTGTITILESGYYSKLYFCLMWMYSQQANDSFVPPQVKSISVLINEEKVIENTSTLINIDNINNIHFIDLFPYNNDLINDLMPFINSIKVHIIFQNSYSVLTKVCVGIIKMLNQ